MTSVIRIDCYVARAPLYEWKRFGGMKLCEMSEVESSKAGLLAADEEPTLGLKENLW